MSENHISRSLPYRERRFLMAFLDCVVLNAVFLFILLIRPDVAIEKFPVLDVVGWFLILNLLWFPIASAFDVYDIGVAGNLMSIAEAIAKAGLLTMGVYLLLPYLTPGLPDARRFLFLMILLPTATLILERGLYIFLLGSSNLKRRVLIYGAGWAGKTLAQAMLENEDITYQLVGFIDDKPALAGAEIRFPELEFEAEDQEKNGVKVVGNGENLTELIARYQIHTVVLAITNDLNGEILKHVTDCLALGIEVLPMPVLYEQITGKIPVQHVGNHWNVSMPIEHSGTGAIRPFIKRVFDIVSAGLGMLFLGIAFPLIALAIYVDSPGPIFYRQTRVGRAGELFRVYKFRSMVPNAEENGAVWARKNDHRVTRVGKILRATHLDEFPQFINILKGEMSAVGPRPERPEFVKDLTQEIPFYRVRHAVKPGMAGWGLVNQGYGSSREDAMVKLQYDLYYIKHQSLWLDIVVLLKTIIDTVTFRGR